MPFVVAYHPRLKIVGKVIHENLNLLFMNDEVRDTFTPRLSENLKSYLVRATLYQLEKTVGFRNCSKKRCKVCEKVQNPDTFRSSVTSETFKINH